jgi:hypothetical protein
MTKRLVAALAVCVIIVVCVGVAFGARQALADTFGHYPESLQTGNGRLYVEMLTEGVISREVVYDTHDGLINVQRWYAQRLGATPAAIHTSADGCVWLTQAILIGWLDSSTSVLICPLPHGTRIAVNRQLRLWL